MKGIIFIVIATICFMSSSHAESYEPYKIDISEMSLRDKVAQMFIVKGNAYNEKWNEIGVGGIFLDGGKNIEEFKTLAERYQSNARIKLLISTDMEGYWNPFSDYHSKNFSEIKDEKESRDLGREHARVLKKAGFNMDFSPVAESNNYVWPGRSFTGSNEEVRRKIAGYIEGMQKEGIIATAKHYPGGSLIKNPHWFLARVKVEKSELDNFESAIKANVTAIMIGHSIVSGAVNSNGRQSTVSKEVISPLREKFDGLIVTDDISMLGLKLSYLFNTKKLCVELVKAGNDIILDSWRPSASKTRKCIEAIAKAVEAGEIEEERINSSLERILKVKGFYIN